MATYKEIYQLAHKLDGDAFISVNTDGDLIYIVEYDGRKIESPNRDWLAAELRREIETKYYG